MRIRTLVYTGSLLASGLFWSRFGLANDLEKKLGCKEVESIETRCADMEKETKTCDTQIQDEIKLQIDAAKKEQDDCKSKHSLNYVLKCKNEIKKATTLVNTPKVALKSKVQKDLAAKPDSACAKADAIGNEQKLCKGPKKVISVMKANCIKDS